jgi:ferritin
VLISPELAAAINAQIGHEFGASMQYRSIAAHFHKRQLALLSKLFIKQAEEEREHAMKFVNYLMDTKGGLEIPLIPAPTHVFASAADAVEAALKWEEEVTRQISSLMDLAVAQNDYIAQSFLQWFHRRAARGGREDGPTPHDHPGIRREKPADGRSVPRARGKFLTAFLFRQTARNARWRRVFSARAMSH